MEVNFIKSIVEIFNNAFELQRDYQTAVLLQGSEYRNQTVGYVLFNVVRKNRDASQTA
jgi:hypothetical protein